VPSNYLDLYLEIFEYESTQLREEGIDCTVGLRLLDDKNSVYCSVHVFRHLWITDHYEFYMKVMTVGHKKTVYPIKRYSVSQKLFRSFRI
jgi:hypothetical protein